jgi:leucine dehydrogenase
MDYRRLPDYDGHRDIDFFALPRLNLCGFFARHRTNHQLALGGTRLRAYASMEEAVTDVLRLSQGMGRKSAMAKLPLDGSKIVLIGDPNRVKSRDYLLSYGRILRNKWLDRNITGEDLNISMSDADIIAETANLMLPDGTESITIAGLSSKGGDPSPITARGVLYGIKACLQHVDGNDTLEGRTVAIEGVGKVGSALTGLLIAQGARVIAADKNPEAIKRVRKTYGRSVRAVENPDDIYDAECDVFAPCAQGAILNRDTIPRLRCRIVAGSANNQLDVPHDGDDLFRRGIIYAPDYVINAGGLINVYDELHPGGYSLDRVQNAVAQIGKRIEDILTASAQVGLAPHRIADQQADSIIGR